MATKVTKWTREKKSNKDFVDPVRKAHQKLPLRLKSDDGKNLKNLAREEIIIRPLWKEKVEFCESHDEAVLRKRLERLKYQLKALDLHVSEL